MKITETKVKVRDLVANYKEEKPDAKFDDGFKVFKIK